MQPTCSHCYPAGCISWEQAKFSISPTFLQACELKWSKNAEIKVQCPPPQQKVFTDQLDVCGFHRERQQELQHAGGVPDPGGRHKHDPHGARVHHRHAARARRRVWRQRARRRPARLHPQVRAGRRVSNQPTTSRWMSQPQWTLIPEPETKFVMPFSRNWFSQAQMPFVGEKRTSCNWRSTRILRETGLHCTKRNSDEQSCQIENPKSGNTGAQCVSSTCVLWAHTIWPRGCSQRGFEWVTEWSLKSNWSAISRITLSVCGDLQLLPLPFDKVLELLVVQTQCKITSTKKLSKSNSPPPTDVLPHTEHAPLIDVPLPTGHVPRRCVTPSCGTAATWQRSNWPLWPNVWFSVVHGRHGLLRSVLGEHWGILFPVVQIAWFPAVVLQTKSENCFQKWGLEMMISWMNVLLGFMGRLHNLFASCSCSGGPDTFLGST